MEEKKGGKKRMAVSTESDTSAPTSGKKKKEGD